MLLQGFQIAHCIAEWKDGYEKRFPFTADAYRQTYDDLFLEMKQFASNPLTARVMRALTERMYKNARSDPVLF